MPLFKKIEFYSFCACTLNLGGLEMRFPNVQSMGAFFWVIYILNRTSGPIFSLLPFFSHKLSNSTILISEFGKLRKCSSKSDFLKCLQKISEPCETPPEDVQMKNVDGAAFVNMNSPRESSSFKDYCEELKKKVKKIGDNVERVDMVFDVYRENSLKSHTRESCGKGLRISIRKNTPIPKDFQKFLRDDDNKNELFQMLADSFLDVQNLIVVSTKSANQKQIPELDFQKWGWQLTNNKYDPRWVTLPEASTACQELIKCGCKKQCKGRCNVKKQILIRVKLPFQRYIILYNWRS